MYGVVLWSDGPSHRVLIWCEDNGDLAYYEAWGDRSATADVRAGDLVIAEVSSAGRQRRACALRLVARGADSDLPRRLLQAAMGHTLAAIR